MKIAIQTLGCKVNQSDSASIEGLLRSHDYTVVRHSDNPDVCIVNTCTVTAKSDYQSRQLIRKAVKSGVRVIATGCYAQLGADELSKIKGLDLIVGNSDKGSILHYLQQLSRKKNGPSVHVGSPSSSLNYQPYYSTRSRAFLKIQDGCNFSCTYCTVPFARGKSRSLSPRDVLKTVKELCMQGYREIVLTGIHIGSYGFELRPKNSLRDMVDHVTKLYPHIRIRLSSIEPQECEEELLQLIKERNICAHLHIPLQSGSDKVLKSMNRGYTSTFYKQLINRIITAFPDISIGTDVITGFPGETDKDFDDTVKFIEELPLSYLHIFPYSRRPNTVASRMNGQISEQEKKNRVKTLLELEQRKRIIYITKHLNSKLEVIVERNSEIYGYYNAISRNYLRLIVKADNLNAGDILDVKVTSLTDHGLVAKPLK